MWCRVGAGINDPLKEDFESLLTGNRRQMIFNL